MDAKRQTYYIIMNYHPTQRFIFRLKSDYKIQILQLMLLHEKLIDTCAKTQQKSCHQIQILQLTQIT